MGEAKHSLNNTIAVRYRFVWKQKTLQYLPHKVRKLKHVPPEENVHDIKPENVIYEDDVEYLRSLDPKEWKHQDHYKVLGIPKLRFNATEEIIRTAYRKKVLKHHPDKRKSSGETIKDEDDYFTCITMAYETLGNSQKRRAYDSVDPDFDNNIPSQSDITKTNFYKLFSRYFDLNSRWSEKQNVPELGGPDSSRNEVEKFYSFWYDFKSWREYSYEDEEDKEKCADRDERRYVDKLNKAERLRKKKEEMSRIRNLVDLAYNNDPRIAKFKLEDKEKKLAAKKAKQTAAQSKKEEAERILREAQLAKERAEAADRARIEAARQEREAMKKALKKERKTLRDFCKNHNYFSENSNENLEHLTALETICENMDLKELEELNKQMKIDGKSAFLGAVNKIKEQIEEERKAAIVEANKSQKNGDTQNSNIVSVAPEWNEENMQLLVKAVNVFPAGTNQRWEVVANFINQHGKFSNDCNSKFTSKMVLSKAKDLQNADFTRNNLKEVAKKQVFDNFKKKESKIEIVVNGGISEKIVNSTATPVENGGKIESIAVAWTTGEQQLLEQALKTYPASTPERWDRIAECIPNRNKKDCIKRYKELVETVKAKKAAQAALNPTK